MVGNQLHYSDLDRLVQRNPQFKCPHCTYLLKEPMETSCGHAFCRSCVDSIFQSDCTAVCPVDGEALRRSQVFPNTLMRNEVQSLEVHCPYVEDGCEWKGKVMHLETHLRDFHDNRETFAKDSLGYHAPCRFNGDHVAEEYLGGSRTAEIEQTQALSAQEEVQYLREALQAYETDFQAERKAIMDLQAKMQALSAQYQGEQDPIQHPQPLVTNMSHLLSEPGPSGASSPQGNLGNHASHRKDHVPEEYPGNSTSETMRGWQLGPTVNEQPQSQMEVELLRAQLKVYEADFNTERQERMALQHKFQCLHQEFADLKRHLEQTVSRFDHERLQGKVRGLEQQVDAHRNSFHDFQDECLAERHRGYDTGMMESELVQSRIDALQTSHADLQASHADLQASHADLQASHADLQAGHADLQAQVRRLEDGEGQ